MAKKSKKSKRGAGTRSKRTGRLGRDQARSPSRVFVCGSCGSHLLSKETAGKPKVKGALRAIKLQPLKATAARDAGMIITVLASPKDAATWSVELDGEQLGLTAGNPHSQPISSGDHTLTGRLWGDPGATLNVTGQVGGNTVATCDCTILPNRKPAADPEDFTLP